MLKCFSDALLRERRQFGFDGLHFLDQVVEALTRVRADLLIRPAFGAGDVAELIDQHALFVRAGGRDEPRPQRLQRVQRRCAGRAAERGSTRG